MEGIVLPQVRKYRDLTIIEINSNDVLVVACDSAGGIGPKEADKVHVSGYVLGRFTARVALMEVLSVGAWPICVTNTLCVEPIPTGADIQRGIADEIRFLKIDPQKILTGSTEKNIPTVQSGIGITVVGLAEKAKLRMGSLSSGDVAALFGLPKVGAEVLLEDKELADLSTVLQLLAGEGIKEIVPVGSRGIKAEIEELAVHLGLKFQWEKNLTIDLFKSAGPSTCLFAVGNENALLSIAARIDKPFNILGKYISK